MSEAKKRRSTGRVTLNDVAQLAGVGAMTVSRALRTPELVSDKMRERIEAAVDELGYIPNRAAGALASATSQTIVVIVPSLTECGCGEVIAGLQQTLRGEGYQIMLGDAQHLKQQEESLLTSFLQHNPAAVVLFGSDPGETIRQRLQAARLPVVEVGAMARSPIDMNVGVSNFDAGYQLTRHLIERGYRNIGFLCARQEQWMLQQRMQGWQKALLDNYLSPDAIINTSERPSFSTGRPCWGSSCCAGPNWMRWSASTTSWRPGCCSNASAAI